AYVICTSPRSGSTLLCKLLAATGIAGKPASYFHEPSVSEWAEDLDLSLDMSQPERQVLEQVFAAAVAEGSGGTELFGLRLQRHSFEFFTRKLAVLQPAHLSDLERLTAAFGRTAVIHLARDDKVEQAVSYVKAGQSGLWHAAPDGTELERLSEPQPLVYDPGSIGASVAEFTAYDQQWNEWFQAQSIIPLRLTYDKLAENPQRVLGSVLEYLGLDPRAASGVQPAVAKLADEVSAEWVRRYRAEHP
ncbi:MAG: Stf0 family sulfotransferase, partial [Pseudomonadota bacterium]